MPKRIVEIGNGFKVLWLKEIRPQHEQFILALLSFLFLHEGISRHRVHVGGHSSRITGVWTRHGEHLLCHGLDRFGGNPSAGWVVDATGGIAMGFGNNGGLHDLPEALEPYEHDSSPEAES